MNLPNFLLSSYGGVALFIFIFLNWRKITMNKNKIEIKRKIAKLEHAKLGISMPDLSEKEKEKWK